MRYQAIPLVVGVLLLIIIAYVLYGGTEEGPDGGERPPVEGTTEGFLLPDVTFTDHSGGHGDLRSIEADFTVLHVVSPIDQPFRPQYVQLKSLRGHFDNVTIEAVTLSVDSRSTYASMAALRDEMGADWAFGVPEGDLNATLSIVKIPTVFLLDRDKVVLERSDAPLGQGALVRAIEDLWGLAPDPGVGHQVGQLAPELVWRDVDGNEGSLLDLRGSVVIVNVWEYECPWCMQLFDQLKKVYENHSTEGLEMVSLDLITWETEELVRSVAEEFNATWAFAVDGDNVQSRYDLWTLPSTIVIDQEGVIRWRADQFVHWSVISDEVERLI